MDILIAFLEGIVTFVSPCLLPMIPVYLGWLAADAGPAGEASKRGLWRRAAGFVLGFSIVFVLLGAFAGTVGGALVRWRTGIDLATGLLVIAFGLIYLDWIRLPSFRFDGFDRFVGKARGVPGAIVFGMVFSVGWTPCVGAFLGSALMLAASSGSRSTGILMLAAYSLGLGIPFIGSALLIDQLQGAFRAVKKHMGLIRAVSGAFLILIGLLMATGLFGRLISALSG